MAGTLDGAFTALVFITVALTSVAIGLVTRLDVIRAAVRRVSFWVVIIANLAVVPLLGYVVARSMPLTPGVESGVVLCAICAAGPLGLKASQISRSDLAWTLSLTVVLQILNVLTLPMWSPVLLDRSLTVQPGDLFGVLAIAILLPALVGGWSGRRGPRAAERRSRKLTTVSNVTLVMAVIVGVAANAPELASSVSSWVLLTAIVVILAAGLVGWWPPEAASRRRASALVTLNRATSVALLVVGRAFPENAEVFTAAVVFGLVQTAAAVALSLYWRLSLGRSTRFVEAGVTR